MDTRRCIPRQVIAVLFGWLIIILLCSSAFARDSRDYGRPALAIENASLQLAGLIDSVITEANTQLYEYGQVTFPDTITVIIVLEREEFDSLVGGHFPDWGVGCAIPHRSTIILLSPYHYKYRVNLPEVLRHEFAHLYLANLATGVRLPRWMDEGFAMMVAHQWAYGDDWRVVRALISGQLIPLRHIDGLNRFRPEKARLAYNQSYLAMTYFLNTYGWNSLRLFVDELRQTNNLDHSFVEAIGLDYTGLQREYQDFIESKYNWVTIFSDTLLLWILLVFLLIVIFIWKWWKSKTKIQEWEQLDEQTDAQSPPNEIVGGSHPRLGE